MANCWQSRKGSLSMRWLAMFTLVWTLGLLWTRGAIAMPAECSSLGAAQRKVADSLLDSQHPYRCCDKTIRQCLQQRPTCKLAERLAADVCRRVQAGENRATIERALARRATSMRASTKPAPIDLSAAQPAGDRNAKVTLVAYVCPRCPYCERLMRHLLHEVTAGSAKGKVKLYVRLFPLRSHKGSTEASLAVMAAAELGKFWPYLSRLYEDFDGFSVDKLPQYAKGVGLSEARFQSLRRSAAVRSKLVESKKEGVRNKVESTPTLFIDGRRYVGDLDARSVVDVLMEEYDRVTGHETK